MHPGINLFIMCHYHTLHISVITLNFNELFPLQSTVQYTSFLSLAINSARHVISFPCNQQHKPRYFFPLQSTAQATLFFPLQSTAQDTLVLPVAINSARYVISFSCNQQFKTRYFFPIQSTAQDTLFLPVAINSAR